MRILQQKQRDEQKKTLIQFLIMYPFMKVHACVCARAKSILCDPYRQ